MPFKCNVCKSYLEPIPSIVCGWRCPNKDNHAALKLAEGQKPPTNSAMDAISALRDLVSYIGKYCDINGSKHLSQGIIDSWYRAKDVLKLHQ
jgi:hypothetical protein